MTFNKGSTFLFSMLTFGLLFGLIPDAIAGCRINYHMANMSQENISLSKFQVKSSGGKWANVIGSKTYQRCFLKKNGRRKCQKMRHHGSGFSFNAGSEVSSYYKATFGCKAKRRYRFEISKGQCRKYIYYPSDTGWTKSTNINFGDISRHCR